MSGPRTASVDRAENANGRDSDEKNLVPSRRQYLDLKAQHPGAILLYRLGDFYETFDEDATILARDARIALTSRSFGRSGRAPMAGIPHHALNHYLGRLLAAGHTVAIAEQMTPPGRGLVERAVTRVISPVPWRTRPSSPPGRIATWRRTGSGSAGGWPGSTSAPGVRRRRVLRRGRRGAVGGGGGPPQPGRDPRPRRCPGPAPRQREQAPGHLTRLESWRWAPDRAAAMLCTQFRVRSLAGFGCAALPAAVGAAGAVLAYLERTNPALLALLTGLRVESPGRWVGLDAATRRNLELTRSFGTGGTRGSLLGVLDLTRTPMGARALRRLVGQPLRDLEEITRRHGIVGPWSVHHRPAPYSAMPWPRSATWSGCWAASPDAAPDPASFSPWPPHYAPSPRSRPSWDPLARQRPPARRLAALPAVPRLAVYAALDPCPDLLALLETAVVEDANGAGTIRPGFAPELDDAVAACGERGSGWPRWRDASGSGRASAR